jgi:hypothetical protein
MKKTGTIWGTFISGLLLFLVSLPQAFAAECLALEPGQETPDARGTAVISDLDGGLQEVDIIAHGLRPEEVYTVWLTAEKFLGRMDMEGLGEPDYSFETDDQGNGSYTATISMEDLQDWKSIEIAFHPDRDPQNMEGIVIDLKTALQK